MGVYVLQYGRYASVLEVLGTGCWVLGAGYWVLGI